jgi:hypothetical protein
MRSITFDTLEFMDGIKESGLSAEQAEAITKATSKAITQIMSTNELATKDDIHKLEIKLIKIVNDSMWRIIGIIGTLQTIMITTIGFVTYFK